MAEHDANAAAEAARKRQAEHDEATKKRLADEKQAREKANAEHDEATKKRLADEKQAREKANAEQRTTGAAVKPTPTQDENDLAASGVHVIDKEPDGSPPDPHITPTVAGTTTSTRQAEAKKPAAPYQTRGAAPHHD